jgi:glycosyltransferase involved in cell wall biosynthesis
MPKVLRIINRFNLGGPTYNAAYLTRYLTPDYKTLLVGGMPEESEGSSEFILKKIGVKPIIIPEMHRSISYNNDVRAYYKIKNIIDRFKPDIVHTHASKAGSLGRLAAYRAGVPVVLHTFHGHVFHSYFGKTKTTIYKQIERRLAKMSTRIIAISDIQKYELSEVHRICEPEKISVVPLGFDLSRFQENHAAKREAFRKKYNLDEDEVAIGIIGRLVPIKNHAFFLQVLQEVLAHSHRKVRAFIIGDGELMEPLQKQAEELGIPFSVMDSSVKAPLEFTSWEREIDVVNAGLDIVCLTSLNEGTPVSLIEAQASGLPVVSTNVGGIENVVLHGKTGLLSERDDLATMVRHVIDLVHHDQLRQDLGGEGWNWVSQKFHYTRLVQDMRELYDGLLKGKVQTTFY